MDAADNLLHNKLAPQRITPRKTTYLSSVGSSRGHFRGLKTRGDDRIQMKSPTRPAPPPPIPDFSHNQRQVQEKPRRAFEDDLDEDGESSDPVSKIWAKIRRCSGVSMSQHRRNISTSTAASVAATVNLPFSDTCGADNRALRRKKAGITENESMAQRKRQAAMCSKQSLTDRTNLSMVDDGDTKDLSKRTSFKGSGKGRRSSGRWGLGNWWLNG